MILFQCDNCELTAETNAGRKTPPTTWYERWETNRMFHACSPTCAVLLMAKHRIGQEWQQNGEKQMLVAVVVKDEASAVVIRELTEAQANLAAGQQRENESAAGAEQHRVANALGYKDVETPQQLGPAKEDADE